MFINSKIFTYMCGFKLKRKFQFMNNNNIFIYIYIYVYFLCEYKLIFFYNLILNYDVLISKIWLLHEETIKFN